MRKSSNKKVWWIIGFLILVALVIIFLKNNQNNVEISQSITPTPTIAQATGSSGGTLILGKRIKISGCISLDGLPDKACTPGETDPNVTQDNILKTICVSGYTKTVRPSVSYTQPLKFKIMQEYGDTDSSKNYELDHLISLELGGSPTSEANLWPEPYNITYNAREKDRVENYLHREVCSGKMSLKDAQLKISNNWKEIYKILP